MIVDDDLMMISLLQTLLEIDGFQVLKADMGAEVVGSIIEAKPDVVLMDVFMDHHDGLDILQELRASPEGVDICVIMSSGMELSEQCREAGADAFLLKPYQPSALISTIQQNLSSQRGGKELI